MYGVPPKLTFQGMRPLASAEKFPEKWRNLMKKGLRKILSECGDLDIPIDQIADDTDLYSVGLSSFAAVKVLIAIEDEFGVEIPDERLNRQLFQTLDAMAAALACLLPAHQGV